MDKLAEHVADIEKRIVKVRHFKTGRIDKYGHVVGIKEYPEGKVPFEHQDHCYDDEDRVIELLKYDRDFSRPTKRLYFYEKGSYKVSESIWIDRYGKIENIHRYVYDSETGLMTERAEYDREGQIFYSIRSVYDDSGNMVEESWHGRKGEPIKRHTYEYDESGEIVIEVQYDRENNMIGFYNFSYDERGNLLEKQWHNSAGTLMSTFRYVCDEEDRVIRISLFGPEDGLENSQEFVYDDVGNIIEEKWYDENENLVKHLRY